jgi:NAD(P)-dependent dehydrogenase (short-subunit alcohol dehydrogenase family)
MSPVQSKLTLELLFGGPADAGAVVTWAVARRGDRLVVTARYRDDAAALVAALRDGRRMAAYEPADANLAKRVERLAAECRIDAVVREPAPAVGRPVHPRGPRRAATTAAFVPALLS